MDEGHFRRPAREIHPPGACRRGSASDGRLAVTKSSPRSFCDRRQTRSAVKALNVKLSRSSRRDRDSQFQPNDPDSAARRMAAKKSSSHRPQPDDRCARLTAEQLVHVRQGADGVVAAKPAASGELFTAEFLAGTAGQQGHEGDAPWQRKNDGLHRIEQLTELRRESRRSAATRRRQRTGGAPRAQRRTRPCRSKNDTTRYGS